MEQHPSSANNTRRIKRRKLAADGQPQEMFQDVKRAAHRWLMAHPGDICEEYRIEQQIIAIWVNKRDHAETE